MRAMKKVRVLFLCTGNSIRSQMAEAFLRSVGSDDVEVFSAGVSPAGIHPLTKQAMAELGIDLSGQHSKSTSEVPFEDVDYTITLCGHAQAVCPPIPAQTRQEHWPIEDPIGHFTSDDDAMDRFRKVRTELRERVETLWAQIKPESK